MFKTELCCDFITNIYPELEKPIRDLLNRLDENGYVIYELNLINEENFINSFFNKEYPELYIQQKKGIVSAYYQFINHLT